MQLISASAAMRFGCRRPWVHALMPRLCRTTAVPQTQGTNTALGAGAYAKPVPQLCHKCRAQTLGGVQEPPMVLCLSMVKSALPASPETSRPRLDLPGAVPHPVELVIVWDVPQQVVVYVPRVRVDAAPDAAILAHAGSEAVPVHCAGASSGGFDQHSDHLARRGRSIGGCGVRTHEKPCPTRPATSNSVRFVSAVVSVPEQCVSVPPPLLQRLVPSAPKTHPMGVAAPNKAQAFSPVCVGWRPSPA